MSLTAKLSKVFPIKEKEKENEDEKKDEKELRGPNEKIFIRSQKILKKGESSQALEPYQLEKKGKVSEEKFILSENFIKLNYSELDPIKNEVYGLMKGKYSSLNPKIAYINPKVNEPHELIEGRPPRKVMIDRMKKVYFTINIAQLLKQVNIDFSKEDRLESWLPLEFFEDKDLDIFTWEEWMSKAKDPNTGEALYIPGMGLHRDEQRIGTWREVHINKYNPKTEKYEGIWYGTDEKCSLSKIYLLFYAENPFLFCKKVSLAHQEREKAESIIRYNFYIDKMVLENLPDINDDIKNRLTKNIEKIPYLKVEQKAISDLSKELNLNYYRTTNKIIFDKFYYSNLSNLLIIDNLKLPPQIINNPDIRTAEVREKGLEIIPPYNYIDSYKKFNFRTLLCKREIIDCLQKIKEECNKIKNQFNIFYFDIKRPLRLQEFKSKQKTAINMIWKKMDEWVKTIKDTLEKSLNGVGKGSFNLNVASKEIYEYLKLKKYMTVVKCLMQDTLYSLVTKSMKGYVQFLEKFIPERVEIDDVNQVRNIFPDDVIEEKLNTTNDLINGEEIAVSGGKVGQDSTLDEDDFLVNPGEKWPLFQNNLTKREDRRIEFTTKAEDLIHDLMAIFDEGLEKMQKIPQVEPILMSNLIKAGKNGIPLKSIIRQKTGKPMPMTQEKIKEGFELNEDAIWICELYEQLETSLRKACEPLQGYINTFKKYNELIRLDPNERLREIKKDDENKEEKTWTYQLIKQDIIDNKEKEKTILAEIPQIIHVSFFQINCKEYRNDLANKFNKIADLETEHLREKAKELNTSILNGYATMKREISREIVTINDLKAVQSYIDLVPIEMQKLKEQTTQVEEIYAILDQFNIKLDQIQFDFRIKLIGEPTEIANTIRVTNIVLDKKKEILYTEQIENITSLKELIDSLECNIANFTNYKSEENFSRATELAIYVKEKLADYQTKGQIYNEREMLFGKPRTDWSKLNELEYLYKPFYHLWIGIDTWKNSYKSWMTENFSKLKGEDVETLVNDLSKNFNSALAKFKERQIPEEIFDLCAKYKKEVDLFKPKADLAVALTRGLKDRHWKELYERTKIDCTPRDQFTFSHIIDAGMMKYLDICQEIGEKAHREQKIEEALHSVDKKWREILFNFTEHKATKLPTISNWNDINKDLDTDILDVQQLDLSPFKGPFAEQITQWIKELLKISSVLEEWNKCQKAWIYLQPVFDSPDIAKDIPYEHKKFKMTDRMWQDLMNGLLTNRNVKQQCSVDGLNEKLKEANMNLENVEKGLNDYMENKRTKFPRFYFISNAQFLEILSQTKDIKKVKDNVNKIFEPMDNIELKDDKYIVSYMSRLGEKISFEEPLLIFGRNVEIWMSYLEQFMFKSVRNYMEIANQDYSTRTRKEWVTRHHPGQIIMAVNQMEWTKEVEKHMVERTLDEYIKEYDTRILDLVALVREKQSRLMSINLSNMITIDVHNMNVMKDLLANHIFDKNAFEWIKHLRYYWEDTYDYLYKKTMPNCMVKSVQTDFPYGYEYVGNAEILVITPLTDKCYLTLMGALRLNFGGAPAGPAGTGKTESTKDLARCLGKLCVVYNCSDDTDYVMIGKFFKGLACCGAWICFDEFNRINIEVLSVIAQQLLQLFEAKEKKATEIRFESSLIKIMPTFCVFITMNPGYAGRTELPDNLKALFRPIAMMVPDYKLIAEINLYSSGYVNASDLATKVVFTMKLSSEQLSTQGHYDFGMRAVKSVLNAARRLKRTEHDKNEDQLLLRALEDVNVPKFVKEDIALFRYIISDLFPGVERPKIDYSNILDKVTTICANPHFNLIPCEAFKQKIIQLYDTLQVRHGLMIVGPAGGGKTSNYTVLKEALSQLDDGKNYFKTQVFIINPKAVKHGEIYSEQNIDTGEWSFGILPIIINECKRDTAMKTKYWIIFDGPVDSMWIEDMNSVLDDSKKLCLASSDIILLNEMITIMFEVEDLVVASPATVSRCGMVYMEPSALGLQPLWACWLKALPEKFEKCKIAKTLTHMFTTYLDEIVYFVRKKLKEPCPTVDNNLAASVMRIIDTFFINFRSQEAQFKKMDDELKQIESMIEGIFYFACIWALGVTTNEEGRKRFDEFFRDITRRNAIDPKYLVPQEGSVYDYMLNEKGEWVMWITTLTTFDIHPNAGYTEIIVPTPDSVRNTFVIKQLLKSNLHVITTGPTGTGKTVNIMELIGKGLADKYMSIILNFSAQTTARQTQDSIQGKLSKIGRNRLAPEKPGIIFIDDLNMPIRQESGAQPPIEILRQWLDHHGWYNLITKIPISITNITLLGAMGIPGGGRSLLSQRFQRHFNLITYNELDDTSIKMIFGTIVKFFLAKFSEEIRLTIDDIISSTMMRYKEIRLEMLPTPQKMHYIFNLRDISKVLQGVSSMSLKHSSKKIDVVRLWIHEMTRVFGDRLVDQKDRDWLRSRLNQDVEKVFKEDVNHIYEYGNKIFFCDFLGADSYIRDYVMVTKVENFVKKINNFLDSYNETPKKKKLKLVMFLDACDHVSRICRILRQPQGNALLLGVGGSGRQSLAKLATYINNFESFQIDVIKGYEMKDFARNVKECLKLSGIKMVSQTFLIVDTQLVFSLMLEYINNILNTGDVPNIYNQQVDKDEIVAAVKNEVMIKYGTLMESNVMKVYLSRVLKHIHVVLAMSPIGESFIQRLRMFPSLVNCCTLDWFSEWPEDALESVALDNFQQSHKTAGIDEYIPKLVQAFKYVHKRVEIESKEFSDQMRRHVYLTPTSYLELLSMYQKILDRKTTEFNTNIYRFENGLEVLKSAGNEVKLMRIEIESQKPLLEDNQRKTKELVIVLEKKKTEAAKEEEDATIKEEAAKKFDAECSVILEKCEKELAIVMPLIDKAVEAIKKVKPEDLQEQYVYKTLSPGCEKLLEGLLIFKLGNSWRTKDVMNKGEASQTRNPYNIKDALIKKINFSDYRGVLEDLGSYCKRENIDNLKVGTQLNNIMLLKEHFQEKNVTLELIERATHALVGLYQFLCLLIEYVDNCLLKIDPIKKDLAIAQAAKDAANKEKEDAVDKKLRAQALVKALEDEYNAAKTREKELQENLRIAELKLRRAEELINLLSGEQTRWTQSVKDLKVQVTNLAGDSLMAAASICYCGPFTYSYRVALENDWRSKIAELGIVHSPGMTMKGLLEDPIEVNDWKVNGLPNDNLSIENGIIIKNTRRWPLMIDPQNQGSNFIKKFGKRKDCLNVVKASDPNFLTLIKGALKLEKWVLLENVSTNLDPTLEPILAQQTTSRGQIVNIKIGEEEIPWSEKFKLHLSTTIPNPHYSPETFVKVTIVNFGITPQGLQEQMMTLLINNESPELEQRKNAILMENFASMSELRDTEDKILNALSRTEGGNISEFLESDDLINSLKESKTKSEEIQRKIEESRETTDKIDKERERYRPAAERSAILFFATIDLSSIDPMYQFSLQWFSKLYEASIKSTPPSNNKDTKIFNLNRIFTKNLYENVCRSLFEKDKLLFSFVICYKILIGEYGDAKIHPAQWRYFLAGPTGDIAKFPNNPTNWISKNEWQTFYRQLTYMSEKFNDTKGLEKYFFTYHEHFKDMYDSPTPHKDPLPGPWEEKCSEFMKLCILKMVRPDKLIAGLQWWIEKNMGKDFIEPPPFELLKSYRQSSNIVPLIFILSPGSDPINDIKKFAEDQGFGKDKFDYVSLGRGQDTKAMNSLEDMRTRGGWVLLQNCHLAKSFMGKLEEIVENFDTNWPDKDFRLWLTSMSNPFFPVSILQNSVKITVEPPKGLKNNLLRTYKKLEAKDLEDDCKKRDEYKALLFGLSFFHAIVQDRRKYGPIGWNIKYDFTNEDWMVSRKQIIIFLEQYDVVPYQVLDYLIGDINYGGRVTDDKDQRLIKNILRTYLVDDIFKYTKYNFSSSGTYHCPEPCEHDMYLTYIENLPVNSEPEVFGLHENADIITAQNEGLALLETVLGIQPRVSIGSGKSQESMLIEILDEIEKKTPTPFDKEEIFKVFPTDCNESMNTVLLQEIVRYNVLLTIMKKSIKTLKNALLGKIVMSAETDTMAKSLYINQVPKIWSEVFLSLKPLSSWALDLVERISFFQKWIDSRKTPSIFWFSGFSFPQAFLTAALQNYARATLTAIDLLSFEFKIMDNVKPSDIKDKPESGVYVYGMFLEGARWNDESHLMDDSLPKELYTDVPMIHFQPVKNRVPPKTGAYSCPLYKVLSRAGTLSTTGHSTNFILYLELPTDREESVWVKAGVAMFLSLKQ